MEQALYRKYRSRTLDEIVGQDHIAKTLKQALKTGRIVHAYLLSGPRGVGKTSVARILAHEINKLPYKDDSIHLDIIEIDAASNRRIDEIRDLRERVHIAPASAKYKVYIIDEVHMLTREAFNALLKTLEEPPTHCIFILATTEPHKLPETIISRTQRLSFKPIDKPTAVKHLADVAKQEKIDITSGALELLAEHGQGSFRDSISLLDQLASAAKKIDEEAIRQLLGLPSAQAIRELLSHLEQSDSQQALNGLNQFWDQGVNPVIAAAEIAKALRQDVLSAGASDWSLELLRRLLEVSTSLRPQDQLEIAILEAANHDNDLSQPPSPPEPLESAIKQEAKISSKKSTPKNPSTFNLDSWSEIVAEVRATKASLYTALRLAELRFENGVLTLAFQFPLHQKKVNQAAHRQLLEGLLDKALGDKIRIECIVDKAVKQEEPHEQTKLAQADPTVSSLQTISSIFGPAEVLES